MRTGPGGDQVSAIFGNTPSDLQLNVTNLNESAMDVENGREQDEDMDSEDDDDLDDDEDDEDEELIREIPRAEEFAIKYAKLKRRLGFYGDKYMPERVDDLDYDKATMLRTLHILSDPNFPHLLFVGPAGSGKKTRVLALLRGVFGEKLVNEGVVVDEKVNGVDVRYVESPVHVELDVSLPGSRDAKVLAGLISRTNAGAGVGAGGVGAVANNVQTRLFGEKKPQKNTNKAVAKQAASAEAARHASELFGAESLNEASAFGYKAFVIYNANLLSIEAQSALRRTMEVVGRTCKVFLVCQDAQQLIDPIQGRCTRIRVASPDDATLIAILDAVVHREKLDQLVDLRYSPLTLKELYDGIAASSRGDLKKALWMLQASFARKKGEDKQVVMCDPDWTKLVNKIVQKISSEDFNSNENLHKSEFPFETIIGFVELLLITVEPEELLLQLRRRFLSDLEFYSASLHGRIQLYKTHCDLVQRIRTCSPGSVVIHVLAFVSFVIGQLTEKKKKDDERHMRWSLLEFYRQRKAEEADPVMQEKLRLKREGLDKPNMKLL
eukprot:g3966.t1